MGSNTGEPSSIFFVFSEFQLLAQTVTEQQEWIEEQHTQFNDLHAQLAK
jgi:hypothetical protein